MQGLLTAQFSTQSDPESAAIRWASNGQFSHVDLVVAEGLLGARFSGGVKVRPQGYDKFTLTKLVSVQVPDVDAAMEFAMAQVGKGYNSGALMDMVLHRTRSFSLDQKSWFCDELVYATVAVGGLQLLNSPNPLALTPWEVFLSPLWQNDDVELMKVAVERVKLERAKLARVKLTEHPKP